LSEERFSRRFGHGAEEGEISVRSDAPEEVRGAILKIAEGELGLRPTYLRGVLCKALRTLPDRANWSDYPNAWEECQDLISGASWYRVYDFVEAVYHKLARAREPQRGDRWEELLNEYFVEAGVGWRMADGLLEARGSEAFGVVVDGAGECLGDAELATARQEIHEALRDLSCRPEPDLTGAIQHAMAALECAAREAVGARRATLGEVLKRNPDLFPRPLDEGLSKLWGYASETGRHLREGGAASRAEVELVVGVAAAACAYLAAEVHSEECAIRCLSLAGGAQPVDSDS